MLAAGTRLGAYEIVSLLGAGGMGEVYRARDPRLGRDVALKVLPDIFAGDAERLARFQREAHVLASLKHANIGAIYGVESGPAEAGHYVLVLELVEGETLADRIARGAIPLDEALPIARQIADALEAAHEQGIIHRDLKPANIKVTPEGVVKVLDFGLAKLGAPDATAASGPSALAALSMSPTISTPAATAMGIILGTTAYMAPEQAKGRPADKRSDMWAFGCVLYEMLTGARAFEGEDVSETLAGVIKGHVAWDALPAETPPAIHRLLRRCLVKDRKGRIADASVARLDIDEALAEPSGPAGRPAPVPQLLLRRWAPAVAAALAGAAVAGAAAWAVLGRGPAPSPVAAQFAIDLPGSIPLATNAVQRVAITRDGRRVIYAAGVPGSVQLYTRMLDQLESVPIRGASGLIGSLFLSPDGEWVAYNDTRDGAFKKVRLDGGPPATIFDAPNASGGFRGAAWGAQGTIVFATSGDAGLRQVPEAGGVPRPLTMPAEDEFHQRPTFTPDGRGVLFVVTRTNMPDQVAAVRLDDPEPKLLIAGAAPRYVSSGHLVFLREGVLWAAAFDAERLELTGEAVPVLEGVGNTGSAAYYDVATNGTLVYSPGETSSARRVLTWVDREGREEPIGVPPRAYTMARLAPDGTRVALDVRDQENDIWIWTLARNTLTRLTFGRPGERNPVWTRDGTRIIYSSDRTGPTNLFWQRADGTGDAERLSDSPNAQVASGLSPDGRRVLFRDQPPGPDTNVLMLPLDNPSQPEPLIQTPFQERNAVVSPDGRWVAYESNATGRFEIYVRPFPDVSGGQWQVSPDGGQRPQWGRSGRELFYVSASRVMRVPVQAGPSWSAGTPAAMIAGPYYYGDSTVIITPYDISLDDRRFLMIKDAPGLEKAGPSLVVVQQWLDQLARLAPAK